VEGREGAQFTWAASLNYDCTPVNDSCFSMPLRATGALGGKNFSLALPAFPGTIEVQLDVRTYGGFGATAQRLFAASAGASTCTCAGNRTLTAAFLGTPTRTPSPSPGWRAAASAKKAAGGGVDTKSPLFVGLLSAGATLVAIALVAVALYATGAGARLAQQLRGGADVGGTLTRPLRRPNTGSGSVDTATAAEPRTLTIAATAAPAGAPAVVSPTDAAAGTGMAAAATTSAVAARRAAANITPLDDTATGHGGTASAPSRPSPAEKAQQSAATPAGARRV